MKALRSIGSKRSLSEDLEVKPQLYWRPETWNICQGQLVEGSRIRLGIKYLFHAERRIHLNPLTLDLETSEVYWAHLILALAQYFLTMPPILPLWSGNVYSVYNIYVECMWFDVWFYGKLELRDCLESEKRLSNLDFLSDETERLWDFLKLGEM